MFLAIPSVVYLLEIQVFKWEMNLDDASCLYSCPQNILLCWLVILGSESVQIVKETENFSFIFGIWYFTLHVSMMSLNLRSADANTNLYFYSKTHFKSIIFIHKSSSLCLKSFPMSSSDTQSIIIIAILVV